MRESDNVSEHDTRQSRIEALRGLTRDEHSGEPSTETGTTRASTPSLAPSPQASSRHASAVRGFWRRWGGLALVIVAAVVIFGTVAGAILKNSTLPFGPKAAPALTMSHIISLRATGALACPSDPIWSPDGKQVAVVALTGAAPGGCIPYNWVTSMYSGSVTTNGPLPTTYALAIFDATTGHAIRTIKLPALATSLLCAGTNPCVSSPVPGQAGVWTPALQSIGWSLDGHAIGVFFTYVYEYGDNAQHYENRGALIVVSANGSGAPRAFIAKGHVRTSSNNITLDEVYGPERYTWDLSTGTASYTTIHRNLSPWTEPFVGGYRLDSSGALSIDQRWRTGDASPWSAGVFNITGPQGASQPTVSYQSSQWLWSSDSRYVSPNLNVSAYLVLSGMTVAPPPDTIGSIVTAPNLTPPNAATTQAVKAAVSAHSGAALARNPSRTLLANYLCSPNGDGQLTVRSVITGKTLAQTSYAYPLTSISLGCKGDIGSILWSPDGAHIASVDGADGQIILWQVNIRA